MKTLDLIRLLCYNKHVNKLNTGIGVSTEVTLPSGSGVARRVGSNPVIRTKKAMEISIAFFIHCESNGISSPLGVYHHRRCISSTVGCISFAMMIYTPLA